MRVLLDTHVVLPLLDHKGRTLALPLRRVLEAPDAELHASVASLWEIAIKWRLKKLDLGRPPDQFPEMLERLGMSLLNIDAAHVLAFVDPEPKTRDPFDRLLLAQCKVEGLRLLTTDRVLIAHPLAFNE
jgi:PIN domain nuclease of toxin-antitoxin system